MVCEQFDFLLKVFNQDTSMPLDVFDFSTKPAFDDFGNFYRDLPDLVQRLLIHADRSFSGRDCRQS